LAGGISGAEAAAVQEILEQDGRRAGVAFAGPGLLLALVGRACFSSTEFVGRLARKGFVDLLDGQREAPGEFSCEDIDFVTALGAFTFDR